MRYSQRPGHHDPAFIAPMPSRPTTLRTTLLITALLGCATIARADWINLTGAETAPNIAEIYVLDDHVKLVLEAYIGDLKTFEELIPDEWMKDLDGQRPALAERVGGVVRPTAVATKGLSKPI